MLQMSHHERRELITKRIATDHARDQVVRALYEAVIQGVEFGPRDLPHPADREWLRGAIAVPLQEAAEEALDALAWEVLALLERAPNGFIERYERSHHLNELGFE
jgi:hypothetical protein